MDEQHLYCEQCDQELSPFEHCNFCDRCGIELSVAIKFRLFIEFEGRRLMLQSVASKNLNVAKKNQKENLMAFFSPAVLVKLAVDQERITNKKRTEEICNESHPMNLFESITNALVNQIIYDPKNIHALHCNKFCSYCGKKLPTFLELPKPEKREFISSLRTFLRKQVGLEKLSITKIIQNIKKV